METGNLIVLFLGSVGVLSGVIMLLFSKNKLKDQQISGLKAAVSLAESITKANEAERIANEQEKEANEAEKDYNDLRNRLLNATKPDGKPGK